MALYFVFMGHTERSSSRAAGSDLFLMVCAASLSFSAVLAIFWAWQWPLVGDASLMHYVVFLLQHGQAPYSQIVDINLPGSYLLQAMSMKLFSAGAAGLRWYDGSLCLLACGCMAALSRPGGQSRMFGWCAGVLFSLVHLQDGLGQAGQRDFAMTGIVLLAYVVLLRRERTPPGLSLFCYELLIGLTVTIKPTLSPLAFVPLLFARGGQYFTNAQDRLRHFIFALAGLCLPLVAAWLWLLHCGALVAFVRVFGSIGWLHGQMGRRSLGYLLSHCTSPLLALFALWVALAMMTRSYRIRENRVFLAGLLCGLGSYLIQAKGYPYQRYPFIAMFLLLLAREIPVALRGKSVARYTAYASLFVACLWMGPRFAVFVHSFSKTAPFQEALAASLRKRPEQVMGGVQCMDTFGGCINVLYDVGIVQSTGFLYDCYLFAPASPQREEYRAAFWQSLTTAQPRLLIVTDQFCFDGHREFEKVTRWDEFARELDQRYVLDEEWRPEHTQRWWARAEVPTSYRIYVRK